MASMIHPPRDAAAHGAAEGRKGATLLFEEFVEQQLPLGAELTHPLRADIKDRRRLPLTF